MPRTLASKAPLGLRKIKSVVNKGIDTDLESGLKLEQEALGFLMQTEDFQEGIAAFMEKREPPVERSLVVQIKEII